MKSKTKRINSTLRGVARSTRASPSTQILITKLGITLQPMDRPNEEHMNKSPLGASMMMSMSKSFLAQSFVDQPKSKHKKSTSKLTPYQSFVEGNHLQSISPLQHYESYMNKQIHNQDENYVSSDDACDDISDNFITRDIDQVSLLNQSNLQFLSQDQNNLRSQTKSVEPDIGNSNYYKSNKIHGEKSFDRSLSKITIDSKTLISNKSQVNLDKMSKAQNEKLANRQQGNPFSRLYNQAVIQQNIHQLKREFMYQLEETQRVKQSKPKINKKSEKMICDVYDNNNVEDILYQDHLRRMKNKQYYQQNAREEIEQKAKQKKINKNSQQLAQNRIKKLVEHVVSQFSKQSDGYINFDQLQMILDKLGVFRSLQELNILKQKFQENPQLIKHQQIRLQTLENKYFEELYIIKQLWNTLNPFLFDDINSELLKEVLVLLIDQYQLRSDKINQLSDIVTLIKDMKYENEFDIDLQQNLFRNKNKKVHENWDIEKLLKTFENLRDHNVFLKNLLQEKQKTTKQEIYKDCTFKPVINNKIQQKENVPRHDVMNPDGSLLFIAEEEESAHSKTLTQTISRLNLNYQTKARDKAMAIVRTDQLYKKAQEQQQKRQQLKEISIENEQQQCSFRPQINNDFKMSQNYNKSLERLTQKQASIKTARNRPSEIQQFNECTFRPQISKVPANHKKTQSLSIKGYEEIVERLRRAGSIPKLKAFQETLRDTTQIEQYQSNQSRSRLNDKSQNRDKSKDQQKQKETSVRALDFSKNVKTNLSNIIQEDEEDEPYLIIDVQVEQEKQPLLDFKPLKQYSANHAKEKLKFRLNNSGILLNEQNL
ncbi:UNKNOWN [Stylonychia lemnae]|uniref:EF-hand domain-containing protein n=1 Tax=Stylonychia lemnae TaxID=5949 RepID=A0A077ZV38_STYLE|nr:UNKNOWN [Stylonychia lemnae]|eukprot:CDW72296.1 UNKNOWN [Stylonychia lemnae]